LRVISTGKRKLLVMSQITIRNIGQDVKDLLRLSAKANGRSLEAHIRTVLAISVGLGPLETNQSMTDRLQKQHKADGNAMGGLVRRLELAKAQNQSLEMKQLVTRQPGGA
jgi:plasmid stability protein